MQNQACTAILRNLESSTYRAQEVWRTCYQELKKKGFTPDIICAHPGWGCPMFMKDLYPNTPILMYCEFFYRAFGADVHFDPQEKVNPDLVAKIRVKNANLLLNLEAADAGVTPTKWQWQQHPRAFQDQISIIHEGIDTDTIKPRTIKSLTLQDGTTLTPKSEVITYIARNLEPYRGFPQAMRAFEILQKERPNCHILVIGQDGVSYGAPAPEGTSYREMMMKELNLDTERIHFLGYLPHNEMHTVLNLSSVHLYLTYPFVLSWSMLEAMSLECLVVGSATAPVQEVIEDGVNGLLVNFFDSNNIAAKIISVLEHPSHMQELRTQARQTVLDTYALNKTLPQHLELIHKVASK